MNVFINAEKIEEVLREKINPDRREVIEIIEKSRELKGLLPQELAVLLQCEDKELIEFIFHTAREIKEAIYGNRLVLFAPLYLSSFCTNNCLYCGFRQDNKELRRKILALDEIKSEVEILERQGHKRLLLVAGEDPGTTSIEYIEEAIRTVYQTKNGNGSIRRVNVNIAPLSVEDFRRLKQTGIGTYKIFQETYHRNTYKSMHPGGKKSNYEWRLFAMDRALFSGIDDVGVGVLFGLYDYRFDVLGLLYHCLHLEEEFGIGPHTISVPRVKPALNAPLANRLPHPVSDFDFKKIVAILRLAVPYTGLILSTRESPSFRDEVFALGISQISAGSKTSPGAYLEDKEHIPDSEQFHLEDTRPQLEVVKDIIHEGYIPSFCTACYRVGRTGKAFMELAKPGEIKNFCIPNCILTFKEYVLDYADSELKEEAATVINRELDKIPEAGLKGQTLEKIMRLEQGERDLYF